MTPTPIELLCPAKNAEIGKVAILHGADAVYIGGSSFGARAAASNSEEEIASLCRFAHLYGARVYVTLNTIFYDDELSEVEQLIHRLYAAGVDALIVQDLALLTMDLPPIALHASTQMDTCTPQQAQRLEQMGFAQIVVARELSLDQIRAIRAATTVPIEGFIHGALCVSYSGRCYVSQHCFGRSANRGCCAQFCRLAFDLVDANDRILSTRHHLSLRDMNRTSSIQAMMEAGVSSFKIEGRLKDANYVKNVTLHYRRVIDRILTQHPDRYRRASFGTIHSDFDPHVEKTFNRGFTEYFLHHRTPDVWSMQTPKAIGAPVGRVTELDARAFTVSGNTSFANGDGLCFFDAEGRLQGFRVNRVEGRRLYPLLMPKALQQGTELFRNEDRTFEKQLQRTRTERTLNLDLDLYESTDAKGYRLIAATEQNVTVQLDIETPIVDAHTPQQDNIIRQLSRFGGTPFRPDKIRLHLSGERFIPSSLLAEWRRQLTERLTEACIQAHQRDVRRPIASDFNLSGQSFDYTANVANRRAADFLRQHGAVSVAPAYEVAPPTNGILMTCRHCLRYAHGQCPRETGHAPTWREPLALRLPDGRRFPLTFDCTRCEMTVHHE